MLPQQLNRECPQFSGVGMCLFGFVYAEVSLCITVRVKYNQGGSYHLQQAYFEGWQNINTIEFLRTKEDIDRTVTFESVDLIKFIPTER